MGKRKLRVEPKSIEPFDKGYFPNKDFEDVPDGGSNDCKHTIWYRTGLQKMFGMDLFNSTQAATTNGNGIFFFDVNGIQKRVAVFGNKFYEDVAGTWTDRTGAITITNPNLCQFISHQQGANKYLIMVNGVDAPAKWTGAGNAAVLGGTPPLFSTIEKYHNIAFGSVKENLYFSDETDPETWDATKWVIPYSRDIVRCIDNKNKLAVLMEDRIGSLQGYGYLDFVREDIEIDNVGCVGRLAATNAFFGENDTPVIATMSKDGLWIIDRSFGTKKIFGEDYIEEFNQANLSKCSMAYWKAEHLLYVALPYGASTECDYVIVVNMKTGAFWPAPDVHANYIRAIASMEDSNGNEFLYYVDTNGYAYKINKETKNYHTGTASQAIDARFKTKRYDFTDVYQFRECYMLADASGDWYVNVSLAFNIDTSDGSTGRMSLKGEGDLLGSTFVLGASALGGSSYVFKAINGVGGFGRFITVTFTNSNLDENFSIKKFELLLKRRRLGGGVN